MPLNRLNKLQQQHVWRPLTQAATAKPPVMISHGKGAYLYDSGGKRYIDMISSWWVNLHGHCHPTIAKAIYEQAQKLEHVIFVHCTHEPALKLCEALTQKLPKPLKRFFFADNGSSAVEAALKMAFQYWRNLGEPQRTKFLAFEGGYHGDTVGAMSVAPDCSFNDPFKKLLFQTETIPFPETWEDDADVEQKELSSLKALDDYLLQYGNTLAAFIAEPLVQGCAGMRMCRPQFLKQVVEKLQSYGILVIFDEIMTGFGRTGEMFACIKADVIPDLICLSKGITGGFLPLSVVVAREEIYNAFLDPKFDKAFAHSHSYTGNPLACAAALASLEVFEQENTYSKIKQIEQFHQKRMVAFKGHEKVHHLRVCGTIFALSVKNTAKMTYGSAESETIKQFYMDQGLLLKPIGPEIYLLPPYCVSIEDLEYAYQTIERSLENL